MKVFAIDSPLMQALSKLGDLILLNLAFIACSIPVMTIGASVTALYSALIKANAGEESPVVRNYFRAFRTEFKRATMLFLVLLLPLTLAGYDIYILSTGITGASELFVLLCMFPLVLFMMIVSYVYPLTAQFDAPVGQTIKNALVLSIANFPITVLVTALNLAPVVFFLVWPEGFFKTMIVWLMVGFSATAWINQKLLHRVFRRFF